jgi:hypothetical protein
MARWPTRRRWKYREELPLPPELDLHGLGVTRAFLHRTVRGNRSVLRRTVPFNVERVTVGTTGHGTFECRALPRALAVVEPPDQVTAVTLEILTGRGDDGVLIVWGSGGPSYAEVKGRSRAWVVGVHGILRQFLDQRQHEVAEPAPARLRRHGWLSGVSVEAFGMVVGAGLLAVIAAVWTFLT